MKHTSTSRSSTYVFCSLALLLLIGSCKHEPIDIPVVGYNGSGGNTGWVPPTDTTVAVTCDPDSVYFMQTVLPLMNSYCASTGCHNSITHSHGVRLYDYPHIRAYVSPGHPGPDQSDLINSIYDGMPPSNHPQMSTAQINAIMTWISQGALNNSCEPSACDTLNVTYSSTIVPLMANMCNGCHGSSNPGGSLNLTNFTTMHTVAMDGRLSGSIQHHSPFHAMPPSSAGLSPCHIQQVLKWIQQEAPNN